MVDFSRLHKETMLKYLPSPGSWGESIWSGMKRLRREFFSVHFKTRSRVHQVNLEVFAVYVAVLDTGHKTLWAHEQTVQVHQVH